MCRPAAHAVHKSESAITGRRGEARTADWHAGRPRGMRSVCCATVPLGRTHLSYGTVNVPLVNPETVNKTITSTVNHGEDHTGIMDPSELQVAHIYH